MPRMSEAEVSLRLAFWLARQNLTEGPIEVAIDGAQVRVGQTEIFPIAPFLQESGWYQRIVATGWQGEYGCQDYACSIRIHSNPGCGDIVADLRNGKRLRAEAKKGDLTRSNSSSEYPLLREALGQLLTVTTVGDNDILAVAVPHSPTFHELAVKWRRAPLITRFGIQILTVSPDGEVYGLTDAARS